MDIFSRELIKINYVALDKRSLLREMSEFLEFHEVVSDKNEFFNAIMEREELLSTGIGKRVAIPHARHKSANFLRIAVYLLDNEIDFQSIDQLAVKIVFMICVPVEMKKEYMLILSAISNFLQVDSNREKLFNSKSTEEIYQNLKGIKI